MKEVAAIEVEAIAVVAVKSMGYLAMGERVAANKGAVRWRRLRYGGDIG